MGVAIVLLRNFNMPVGINTSVSTFRDLSLEDVGKRSIWLQPLLDLSVRLAAWSGTVLLFSWPS
jgi:hypothetical protein